MDIIGSYFDKLQKTISMNGNGITPDSIWNMDETGFQIGVGKSKMVITRRHNQASHLGVPTNRESATAIEAISVEGEVCPAFLILSGRLHQDGWYKIPELSDDTVIGTSDSGYSNGFISLEWIKHFAAHTAEMSKCQYHLRFLDGYGSHHTFEFIEYAYNHNIILFGLPPHLTHLLQPLDVVVFQPLKHWPSHALDTIIRDGVERVGEHEFLTTVEDVRRKTLKPTTISSSFAKTGIWPFDQ